MAQSAQIELLVPLECAFNCASTGTIDTAIGCSVVELIAFSMHCTVEKLFQDRRILFCNSWIVFIPCFHIRW